MTGTRSTASSGAAEPRQADGLGGDLSPMRHDPIALFRLALRCGDDRLADLLCRAFRRDPELADRADHELLALSRARWPAEGGGRRTAALIARSMVRGVPAL